MGRRGTSGRLNLRMVGVLVYDITITSPAREPGQEPVGRSLSGTLWGNPLGKPSGETLWGNPRGNPRGILEDPSGSTPHHSSQRPQAQKWGIPTLLPTRGKGGKRGGKGGVTHTISSIFLWGRTPRPPLNWHEGADLRSAEKTKGGGARVWRAGRTKSIDLIETSSMELLSHSYLASLRSYNAPKFTPFPGVIRLYWWGKQG